MACLPGLGISKQLEPNVIKSITFSSRKIAPKQRWESLRSVPRPQSGDALAPSAWSINSHLLFLGGITSLPPLQPFEFHQNRLPASIKPSLDSLTWLSTHPIISIPSTKASEASTQDVFFRLLYRPVGRSNNLHDGRTWW